MYSKEIIELLLSEEVSFDKRLDGSFRGHIYPPILGDFYGKSKEDILIQIVKKKKSNLIKIENYFKLPNINQVLQQIVSGDLKVTSSKRYKVRVHDDPNYWQFDLTVNNFTGKELLWKLYCKDYVDYKYSSHDDNLNIVYDMTRNDKVVDSYFWDMYPKQLKEFEKTLKPNQK